MEEKVKHYQQLFGLENWTIKVTKDAALNANARTMADPRYYTATITFRFDSDPDNEDRVIVHEMIHIVMALYDFYADNLGKEGSDELFFVAREKSVSELTHIIMRILNEKK